MDNLVVYGVDIGKNNRAWARVDSFPGVIPLNMYQFISSTQVFIDSNSNTGTNGYICGKSISKLANHIINDLKAGKAVALGFEAPMWIHKYAHGFKYNSVLSERFDEEGVKYRWFSSGASASTMAFPLGCELFNCIKNNIANIRATTDFVSWKKNLYENIVLFEGFFAGEHKIACHGIVPVHLTGKVQVTSKNHLHYWDAFSLAAAYWGRIDPRHDLIYKMNYKPIIHCVRTNASLKIESLWHRIADEASICISPSTHLECEVVTFPI